LADLQSPSDGNLNYQVDFRSVYATVLSNWLCIDADLVDSVMGQRFERMEDLGLYCQGVTSTRSPDRAESINMNAYLSGGDVVIDYKLPSSANVGIHFFDVSGRKLASPFRGPRAAGSQSQRVAMSSIGWASGVYVISLEVNGQMYSRKLRFFK
jgi:hypothetical protein